MGKREKALRLPLAGCGGLAFGSFEIREVLGSLHIQIVKSGEIYTFILSGLDGYE